MRNILQDVSLTGRFEQKVALALVGPVYGDYRSPAHHSESYRTALSFLLKCTRMIFGQGNLFLGPIGILAFIKLHQYRTQEFLEALA